MLKLLFTYESCKMLGERALPTPKEKWIKIWGHGLLAPNGGQWSFFFPDVSFRFIKYFK